MASLITRSNIFGKLKHLELKPEGETFRVETLGCQLPGKNKNKRICQHFYHFRIKRLKCIAQKVLISMLLR
jgi:hypothetical protein